MLKLMLLRHAKAGPHGHDDFARDLTDAGREQASALGAYLEDRGIIPDQAYVSAAARTRATFEIMQAAFGHVIASAFEDTLYNASAGQVLDLLRDFAAESVMIVGHNPGVMDAALALAREGDLADLQRMRSRFPPCSLAMLSFDQPDWRSARAAGGRLDLYVTPEDLG